MCSRSFGPLKSSIRMNLAACWDFGCCAQTRNGEIPIRTEANFLLEIEKCEQLLDQERFERLKLDNASQIKSGVGNYGFGNVLGTNPTKLLHNHPGTRAPARPRAPSTSPCGTS